MRAIRARGSRGVMAGSLPKGAGCVPHKLAVHQVQGLQRTVGRGADVGGGVRVGTVEQAEKRMAMQPLRHQVHAAVIGRIVGLEREVLRPMPFVESAERVRPRRARVQRAATSSIASRIASASSRWRLNRQYHWLAGSIASSCRSVGGELIRLRLHDQSVQRLDRPAVLDERRASQSSSSGWVGGLPRVPKFDGVATIPRPKWCCHTRLTITRAVRGLCGEVSQSASSSRPLSLGPGRGSSHPKGSAAARAEPWPRVGWARRESEFPRR